MTIGDKCPYCGRELLSGYLQSARQIIWSQEEKSISFRADEEGDLIVSRGIWNGSFADCRYCAGSQKRACKGCKEKRGRSKGCSPQYPS